MTGAQAEHVFFDSHDIKVTNSRFIVHKQTYAMAAVNSVKVGVTDRTPSNTVPSVIIAISALWLLVLIMPPVESWPPLLFPVAFLVWGIMWFRSIKKLYEYRIVLTTSSGETSALTSNSEPDIRVVEKALNDAIVYRG